MPFPTDTFLQFFRNSSNYVAQEFENFYAQLAGYLSKEHKDDGTHGDITVDTLQINDDGQIVFEPPSNDSRKAVLRRDSFGIVLDNGLLGGLGTTLPFYVRGGAVLHNNVFVTAEGTTASTDRGDIILLGSEARIRDVNHSEGFGHWTTYTPSWAAIGGTQPSIGDGTLTGAYTRIGDTIHYRVTMVAGGTTGFGSGGAWTFSLPVTSVSYDAETPLGTLAVYDSSTSTRAEGIVLAQSTTVVLPRQAGVVLTNAAPWTWASGDKAIIFGTYEAA